MRAWSRDGGLGSLKVEISAWALGLGIEGGLRYDRMSAGNTAVSLNYGLQVHPLFWLAPKFSRWFDPSLRAGALAGVNHESSHLGSHLGVYVGAGADIRLFALGSVPRRDYLTKVDRKNLGDLRTTLYLSGNYDRTWTSSSSSSSSNSELGALTLGLSLVKRW